MFLFSIKYSKPLNKTIPGYKVKTVLEYVETFVKQLKGERVSILGNELTFGANFASNSFR